MKNNKPSLPYIHKAKPERMQPGPIPEKLFRKFHGRLTKSGEADKRFKQPALLDAMMGIIESTKGESK